MRAFIVFALIVTPAMGASSIRNVHSLLKMSPDQVKSDLMLALHQSLAKADEQGKGSFVDMGQSLLPTFESLPKNNSGRLDGPSVRYLVHSYFLKEHGWLIRGLEPHHVNTTFEQAPAFNISGGIPEMTGHDVPAFIQMIIRGGTQGLGFRLSEVVAQVAILQNLILNEGISRLEDAYLLNGHSFDSELTEDELDTVLDSYLVLLTFESTDPTNVTQHALDMQILQQERYDFMDSQVFVRDTLRNFAYRETAFTNPFSAKTFVWDEAAAIMMTMSRHYGKFRDFECQSLKENLAAIDTMGYGRVPIGRFYEKGQVGPWSLTESVDFLRQAGVLDESAPDLGPQVIIPNYISSVSNCDVPSEYYSVCCIHECEGLLTSIEGSIKAPTAVPDAILELVGNLSSATVEAPRNLSSSLVQALEQVAQVHNGSVPLHSRLFAQWMHYAFPLECPYPHMSKKFNPLTPSEWFKHSGKETSATKDEVERYTQLYANHQDSHGTASEDGLRMSQWTLEEEMLYNPVGDHEDEERPGSLRRFAAILIKVVVGIAGIFALVGQTVAVARTWRSAATMVQDQGGDAKKSDGPFPDMFL